EPGMAERGAPGAPEAATEPGAESATERQNVTVLTGENAKELSTYLSGNDPVPHRFILQGLTFDTAHTSVNRSPLLDEVAETLKSGSAKVRLEGFTDFQGDGQANVALGEARANAVKRYLVAKGVPEERIVTVGKGEAQPVAANETEEGRAMNRRVELVV